MDNICTPMLLATAGYSIAHGAALLKLRRGLTLGLARQAMGEAHAALARPLRARLEAGLIEVACKEVGLDCIRRASSDVGAGLDRAAMASKKANDRAEAALRTASALPKELTIEIPNPLGRQILERGRYPFPGQCRASGRPLLDLG